MAVNNLLDLHEVLLLKILSYITNIREKIRLAQVNSTFYNLVHESCRTQNYKLVNYSDYMYQSEYKDPDNTNLIINLHDLLKVAPRLTHLVDKIYHFGYESSPEDPKYSKPLPLIHCRYIYLDLCHAYFFGRRYNPAFDEKINVVLSNIPVIHTLDIRTDRDHRIDFPVLPNLKVFKFGYYITNQWPELRAFPISLVNLVSGKTPNLEELVLSAQHVDLFFDLAGFMSNLSLHCPNLRSFKMWLQLPHFSRDVVVTSKTFNDENKLLQLEYLDLRGVAFQPATWEKILSLTPNLKYLAFDPSTDPKIKHLIQRNCRSAKYSLDRPFELEEEYRIYNQLTYEDVNPDRFCCYS